MPLRLLGHPVHPLLVHFPVALWTLAPVAAGVYLIRTSAALWTLAWSAAALGTITATVAMAAGFTDYLGLPSKSPAQQTAHRHMGYMSGAWGVFLGGLLPAGPFATPPVTVVTGVLGLWTAGFALMTLGGHFGARLVYDLGVGQTGRTHEGDR